MRVMDSIKFTEPFAIAKQIATSFFDKRLLNSNAKSL